VNTQTRLFITALLIAAVAGPAYPQNRDIIQLQKDMIEVQTRVKQLQSTVDQNDAVMKGLMEKMTDQVATITSGVQKISQTIEGLKSHDDDTAKELRMILTTMNGSITALTEGLTAARSQIGSMSREITTLKTTAEPLATADDLWRTANVDYLTSNWGLAIGGLQEFLSKFPDDPRAPEAQLFVGNALTAQKKYDLAVTQYDIVLQKYPDSDTTKTALLKKGLALAELNPQQATATLQEVAKKYPGTPEAQAANAKLKELQPQRPKAPAR